MIPGKEEEEEVEKGKIDNNITRFGLRKWGHVNFSTIERWPLLVLLPLTKSAITAITDN